MSSGWSARIRWPTPRLASDGAFVVVQEMFMTETAKRADIIFPAASAYEKDGTVTNVTGEVQRLKRALKTMGAKPDLEIIGFIAKEMGVNRDFLHAKPDASSNEIRTNVRGYDVPLPVLMHRRRGADDAGERASAGRHPAGPGSVGPRHSVHVGHARAVFAQAQLRHRTR